jgi:hypothetical protein
MLLLRKGLITVQFLVTKIQFIETIFCGVKPMAVACGPPFNAKMDSVHSANTTPPPHQFSYSLLYKFPNIIMQRENLKIHIFSLRSGSIFLFPYPYIKQ